MPPIQPAKGTYKNGPQSELVRCPHCDTILNQHLMTAVPIAANKMPADPNIPKLMDLFGGPPEPVPAQPPPDPGLVASGDIFAPNIQVPLKIEKTFEEVDTGKARPEKREQMVIPGMRPAEPPQDPVRHKNYEGLKILDNPVIGGKVTICVLLYGEEYFELHRRCLTSICQSVPPSRMELRVATNQVGLQTVNYLNSLPVKKIYPDHKNRRKYPAMRQMFWDEEDPITTNYVVWFDDDSYVLNEQWLSILGMTIAQQRPQDKVGMYGARMYHPLRKHKGKDPKKWFSNAKWWQKRAFQDARGRETPNGDKIHFAVGGFWCISLECMKACDIPDTRLNHNGGDCCIGEQLHQGGYKIKLFNEKKQFIKTSGAPRRGFHEQFPWYR